MLVLFIKYCSEIRKIVISHFKLFYCLVYFRLRKIALIYFFLIIQSHSKVIRTYLFSD